MERGAWSQNDDMRYDHKHEVLLLMRLVEDAWSGKYYTYTSRRVGWSSVLNTERL